MWWGAKTVDIFGSHRVETDAPDGFADVGHDREITLDFFELGRDIGTTVVSEVVRRCVTLICGYGPVGRAKICLEIVDKLNGAELGFAVNLLAVIFVC